MRIVHVVPDNEIGGGHVNVARLMRVLRTPSTALLPGNAEQAVRAVFADVPHEFGNYRGRGSLVSTARAILATARHGDVVNTHGTRAALAAVLARTVRPSLHIVQTVRGFHGLATPGRLQLRVRLERLLAARVDATVFVSEADADLAARTGLVYRGPTRVIPNGIPLPPEPAPGARDIDLLFVGRLVHQKHPEAFVETLSRMVRPVRAVMIGAGEKADLVDALAADRAPASFKRIDGLPHDEVLACMTRARILVMTSRWEGLPTVAIEALLSGALVAGFHIPPLAEVLHGSAEALLTPHEPATLAERLEALLSDEDAVAATVDRLRADARARYDPAAMAGAYEEVYAAAA